YPTTPSLIVHCPTMEGVVTSAPYPPHHDAHYPRSKALADRLVLSANGPDLATVALRPHLIWGPGDNHLVPRILARARAGQLRRIGHRENKVDSVYIDNAADAHILAADRLAPGSPIAGKAYFITNDEPLPLWDLVNRILSAAGIAPVTRTLPFGLAYSLGWLLEKTYAALLIQAEPPMTRFLAS